MSKPIKENTLLNTILILIMVLGLSLGMNFIHALKAENADNWWKQQMLEQQLECEAW